MNASLLLSKNFIGFDSLLQEMERHLNHGQRQNSFPPYDLRVTEDGSTEIVVAVAGFKMSDLDIVKEQNLLTIVGKRPENDVSISYSHQGIGKRDFNLVFRLADYIEIKGATLEDGLLTVKMVKEIPEEAKPKKIQINA